MKKGLTELVFVLDKSGSMRGLEKDTIGGFNSMLEKQKAIEGECLITTVLFDNNYVLLHDRADIRGVKPITEKEYFVGGSTALLDAVGRTISKIKNAQNNIEEDYRTEKVMFVIITDGYENSSREYNLPQVKELIENQKQQGWEFIFLGANIDVVQTAKSFGISENRSAAFTADDEGVQASYQAVDHIMCCMRSMEPPQYSRSFDVECEKVLRKMNEDTKKRKDKKGQ
ncbi:MAG: VWA domain-containing protein [Clostridia bacterium]|nr:VWA domain-containing protein [Clostridia bacterium]